MNNLVYAAEIAFQAENWLLDFSSTRLIKSWQKITKGKKTKQKEILSEPGSKFLGTTKKYQKVIMEIMKQKYVSKNLYFFWENLSTVQIKTCHNVI